MKWFSILAATISFLVPVALLIGCGGPETVTFPDENLDTAIRAALGKTAGEEITVDELANLTELDALARGITDLSGLEYCTNLTQFHLGGNQISDVSPLSSLASLTGLGLSENKISDIYPLSSLISLTQLHLDGNQISDISPLSSLTSLTVLNLRGNQISGISPLSSLANLTWLSLGGNQISDISPLVENSGLVTGDEIWLEDNNLDLTEGSEDMQNIRALEDRGVEVNYQPL